MEETRERKEIGAKVCSCRSTGRERIGENRKERKMIKGYEEKSEIIKRDDGGETATVEMNKRKKNIEVIDVEAGSEKVEGKGEGEEQ